MVSLVEIMVRFLVPVMIYTLMLRVYQKGQSFWQPAIKVLGVRELL